MLGDFVAFFNANSMFLQSSGDVAVEICVQFHVIPCVVEEYQNSQSKYWAQNENS